MTYRNPRMDQPINELMSFDHVVAVMPDGRVIDTDEKFNLIDVRVPEVYIDYEGPFAEAQISDQNDRDMVGYFKSQGWEVLNGYSNQYGYSGPIMHVSESIGGGLEDRIREEPGFWVALTVEISPNEDDPEHEDNGGNGESEAAGWIVARKIGSEDEIAARTQWIAEDVAPFHIDPGYSGFRPQTDEDVAMSSPTIFYKGESEEDARTALALKLTEYAGFKHIREAGESPGYLAAAEDIRTGEVYSVQPGHRIQRIRAMLMPKENSK